MAVKNCCSSPNLFIQSSYNSWILPFNFLNKSSDISSFPFFKTPFSFHSLFILYNVSKSVFSTIKSPFNFIFLNSHQDAVFSSCICEKLIPVHTCFVSCSKVHEIFDVIFSPWESQLSAIRFHAPLAWNPPIKDQPINNFIIKEEFSPVIFLPKRLPTMSHTIERSPIGPIFLNRSPIKVSGFLIHLSLFSSVHCNHSAWVTSWSSGFFKVLSILFL